MSPLDFDSQFMVIRNTLKTELAKILALPGMAKDSEDILVYGMIGDTGDTLHVGNFTQIPVIPATMPRIPGVRR